jgi:hypothetical protein
MIQFIDSFPSLVAPYQRCSDKAYRARQSASASHSQDDAAQVVSVVRTFGRLQALCDGLDARRYVRESVACQRFSSVLTPAERSLYDAVAWRGVGHMIGNIPTDSTAQPLHQPSCSLYTFRVAHRSWLDAHKRHPAVYVSRT